jgi:hypothetical protein
MRWRAFGGMCVAVGMHRVGAMGRINRKITFGMTRDRRPFRRPKRGRNDNIKVNFEGVASEVVG